MKKLKISKQFLYQEYIIKEKSFANIANEIGCASTTIKYYLKKYNIPIRTKSEASKIRCKDPKKHSRFKHGKTLKSNFCIDCLKKGIKTQINWQSNRCRSCAGKYRFINNSIFRAKLLKILKSKVYKQKQRKTALLKWSNKEFKEKSLALMRIGRKVTPNKPEKLLIKLLNKLLPKTYSFVGNGKVILGSFCPDFINCNGQKKIIEHFGCYWHKCKDCGFGNGRLKDVGRLKEYSKLGYKTLIIWEHELKDLDKVKEKILEFNNGI